MQPSAVSNVPSSGNRSQRPSNQKIVSNDNTTTGSRFKYRAIKAQPQVFEVVDQNLMAFDQELHHITLGIQDETNGGRNIQSNQPRVV